MRKYKVDSLSKYLALIEKNNISDFIYRGQNEPYFSIQASGFRPYCGGWDSDMIYDMPYLHTSFYNRIIGQLSEDERKYFLAFCQHHGIPTNLVDVSYSPLVALFFACDGKSKRKFTLSEFIGNKSIDDFEKNASCQNTFIHNLINQLKKPFYTPYAHIYMLNKERLINVTDLIVELNGKNLFEKLLTDEILTIKLLEIIKEHFKSINCNILNIWLKNILGEYVTMNESNSSSSLSDELYGVIKSAIKLDDIDYKDISKAFEKAYKCGLYQKILFHEPLTPQSDSDIIASLYTIILIEILDTLKNVPQKVNIGLDIYFTYQPPQLFERISNQQSLFIYQPYLYTNDNLYNYCELNIQSINADIMIEIENDSNILKELHLLGTDKGTIYGDIDNIAKSVLYSSGKLFKA